jgi:hypothetical protein
MTANSPLGARTRDRTGLTCSPPDLKEDGCLEHLKTAGTMRFGKYGREADGSDLALIPSLEEDRAIRVERRADRNAKHGYAKNYGDRAAYQDGRTPRRDMRTRNGRGATPVKAPKAAAGA